MVGGCDENNRKKEQTKRTKREASVFSPQNTKILRKSARERPASRTGEIQLGLHIIGRGLADLASRLTSEIKCPYWVFLYVARGN